MILYSNLCETLSRPPNKQPRCFARSVEDLQYTLADFYLVIVDCLDSGLPSLRSYLLKASTCRSFRRSISLARSPMLSRSMRVIIIVALNEGNNHPFIAFGASSNWEV